MAASQHRVQFDFEAMPGQASTSGSKSGWTEAWYDTLLQEDAAAANTALNVMAARQQMLTNGWRISSIRLSQWSAAGGLSRKAQHIFITPLRGGGLYGVAADNEQPYDALVCSVNTSLGFTRPREFRGIPNSIINAGGAYVGDSTAPAWAAKLGQFLDSIDGTRTYPPIPVGTPAAQYGYRLRSGAAPIFGGSVTLGIVGEVSPYPGSSPRSPTIFVTGVTGLVRGQTVVLRGWLNCSGLNGSWQLRENSREYPAGSGNWVIPLASKRRGRSVTGTPTGGSVTAYTFFLDPVTLLTPGYGNSRQTGRPSRLPRGRRSAAGLP